MTEMKLPTIYTKVRKVAPTLIHKSQAGLVDILIKLTGMNTDHCAKDAYEMEELKKWADNAGKVPTRDL
jgi:hypothetical protein